MADLEPIEVRRQKMVEREKQDELQQLEEKGPIEEHPHYCAILDLIEKYGSYTKATLVSMSYDESGEGLTKQELKGMSFGKLLADMIDREFGGTCQ